MIATGRRRAPVRRTGPVGRRPGRTARLVVGLIAAGLLASACTGGSDATGTSTGSAGASIGSTTAGSGTAGSASATGSSVTPTFSTEPLVWSPCTEEGQTAFQCATYPVPLDWSDPGGRKIELALRKLAATGTSKGSVFFNPGGPGGTASGVFVGVADLFPKALTQQYDLVSWDPRGVGESTSAQCFGSFAEEAAVLAQGPTYGISVEQQESYRASLKQVADRCAADPGAVEILRHLSTGDTARDLEQLRIADGGAPLTYWGISYGTFLGATYANLFPDHIRAMVLDGVIDPAAWVGDGSPQSRSLLGARVGAIEAGEVFEQFLIECTAAGVAACPFAAESVDATRAKWQALQTRLGQGPLTYTDQDGVQREIPDLPALGTRVGDALGEVWPVAIFEGWVSLAGFLQRAYEASTGSGPGAQPGSPAPAPPSPSTDPVYVGQEGLAGISCDAARPPAGRLPTLLTETQQEYGIVGVYSLYFDVFCLDWTIPADGSFRGPFDVTLAHPPLIVNTTHDPSTAFRNVPGLQAAFPGSARLNVNGYGHTTLFNRSTCASDLIVDYLVDQALPADGTWCDQDVRPFQPLPAD